MATAPETLRDGWLEELGEFLAIPSVSADPAHADDVLRAAEWVGGSGSRASAARPRCRRTGGSSSARSPARRGAPTVLVYGHYDVQPPDPLELWESDPFAPSRAASGSTRAASPTTRGSSGCSSKAIASLAREGELPVTFRVVCDGEEETGGDAISRFLDGRRGPASTRA